MKLKHPSKELFLSLIAITVIMCALATSTIVMVGHYNTTKASVVLDAPEPFEAGDTAYIRSIGNMLSAEHYHNQPDQQDKSRIKLVTQ